MSGKWQSKVDALIRLAEDRGDRPEGRLAREKLRRVLRRFPELAERHKPFDEFAHRTFTGADLGQMKRQGISTAGEWSGGTLDEAIAIMVADYKRRLWGRKSKLVAGKMKRRVVIEKRLKDFAVELERIVGYDIVRAFQGSQGAFGLRPFRRSGGSVYDMRQQHLQLEAWAAYIYGDIEQQELGPGIKLYAVALPGNRTRLDAECLYPAFREWFGGMLDALVSEMLQVAFLEHELAAMMLPALEAHNA